MWVCRLAAGFVFSSPFEVGTDTKGSDKLMQLLMIIDDEVCFCCCFFCLTWHRGGKCGVTQGRSPGRVFFYFYLFFIRIYLLARRNLLLDILRLPSSRRDGARTSYHTHCCIGAHCATHCATGDDRIRKVSVRFVRICLPYFEVVYIIVLRI